MPDLSSYQSITASSVDRTSCWRRRLNLFTIASLTISLFLIPFDRELIQFFPLPDQTTFKVLNPLMYLGKTRVVIRISLAAMAIGALVWWLSKKEWKNKGLFVFQLAFLACSHFLISGAVVQLIKWITGRPRPEFSFAHNDFLWQPFQTFSLYVSFPSGHANTGLSLALVFCYVIRNLHARALFILFAFAMGTGRIILYKHYPSDVLAGWGIATLTMFLLLPIVNRIIKTTPTRTQ